ncbi:PspC domain-containing protein [Rubrivirga sp. S365]|uniref:PspC domain-containing protein n=1 Tax=Rubrivirga sp. S365 TaxID=3076080 RepID=UPI0028C80BD2|nr:PspC domain-containing protein [Rubrivirga sp. S365]MDT7857677.1 PspC domain-containing protein [Rubrivirga sp. S365]
MPTRQRRRPRQDDALDDEFSSITDEDIEAYMAEQDLEEEAETESGFWNLQTASGMGLIGLGALYSLQQIGILEVGSDVLVQLVQVLPVFAAVLIMLTGFGVLSWSPAARRRKKARRAAQKRKAQRRKAQRKTLGREPRPDAAGRRASEAFAQAESALRGAGRTASRATAEARERRAGARRAGHERLAKDRRNRKVSGVAAGMANYFGLDPTVVRIGWVVAAIFSQGAAILPYILLSMILPDEESLGRGGDDDPVVRVTGD